MNSAPFTRVLESLTDWLARLASPMPSLKIGIYGYTQAGKTLFLFNLLRYLQQEGQLDNAEVNEKCWQFVDAVSKQIERHGRPGRTSELWEGISFVWKISYSPKETRRFRITVHDLFGEELDKEAREGYPPSGHLTRMVQQCNAFLFFFNPTQKQDRYSNDYHLTLEQERAESLLEALLEGRGPWLRSGPGMRPVIFVITAKDEWESNPELRGVAQSFRQRIAELVKEKWPQAPNRLIDLRKIVREVANPPRQQQIPSEQGRQLTAVVRDLFDLHNFARQLRLTTIKVLAALIVVVLFVWLILSTLTAQDPHIESTLTKLQPWAENWQFSRAQEKPSELGNLLREGCVLALRPNQRAQEIRKRLEEIGGHLIRAMDGTIDDKRFDALNRILAPPKPSHHLQQLRDAQRLFWEKLRSRIVSDLKKATNSDDCLNRLKEAEERLETYKVPGGKRLFDELKQAINFVKSRKDPYQVVFEPILKYNGQEEQRRKFGHCLHLMGRDHKWWLEPDKKGGFGRLPDASPVTETFNWGEEVVISIYYYDYTMEPKEWKHIITWKKHQLENKLPMSSLSYIGAPFLGSEGQQITLTSTDYTLTLLIKETRFSGVIPHILKRTAD